MFCFAVVFVSLFVLSPFCIFFLRGWYVLPLAITTFRCSHGCQAVWEDAVSDAQFCQLGPNDCGDILAIGWRSSGWIQRWILEIKWSKKAGVLVTQVYDIGPCNVLVGGRDTVWDDKVASTVVDGTIPVCLILVPFWPPSCLGVGFIAVCWVSSEELNIVPSCLVRSTASDFCCCLLEVDSHEVPA